MKRFNVSFAPFTVAMSEPFTNYALSLPGKELVGNRSKFSLPKGKQKAVLKQNTPCVNICPYPLMPLVDVVDISKKKKELPSVSRSSNESSV